MSNSLRLRTVWEALATSVDRRGAYQSANYMLRLLLTERKAPFLTLTPMGIPNSIRPEHSSASVPDAVEQVLAH